MQQKIYTRNPDIHNRNKHNWYNIIISRVKLISSHKFHSLHFTEMKVLLLLVLLSIVLYFMIKRP